jgi:hypothetical protein
MGEKGMSKVVYGVIGSVSDREGSEPILYGLYTKESLAKKVKMVSGPFTKVEPIEIDHIPPGWLESFKAYGITIEKEDLPD